MGTNFASMWQKAAKLVSCSSTKQQGSPEAEAASLSAMALMNQLEQLNLPPKAVWKKLVQQMKVGCRTLHGQRS